MWGFNSECEDDLPEVESALRCIVYDLVNYMIIDYQILELDGDPSEPESTGAVRLRVLARPPGRPPDVGECC